ncbi:bfce5e03-f1d8-4377-9e63-cf9590edeb69 [Sclerotinia trifoliorum]|uniref:Bfce5e03-f1d8-4377-9e63-cf9590edeb69 n=1 Tax=Sclerotinia trifoliorum TaxID=28548 RepID=A0A8H2W2H6_9HELO|nr:bfce5e03-f1d8-4377-9e63-cf9590edeb69 [Sclerotinia trifoliorum]
MESFIPGDRAVHALINPAHTVDSIRTSNPKDTALLGAIILNPSSSTKDRFGEEVPVLGKNWYANCTADSSFKALHEEEYCPEDHITFGTRYTISYFTKEGVLIEHPVEDFIEEPIPAKKLIFNRQRASNLANSPHLAGGPYIDLQKPIKMESNTPEHPRQPMICGYFDTSSEVSHSSTKDKCVDGGVNIAPTPSYQEKPSIDSSLGIKTSNTIRNMATVGLQVVHHLDEKSATRAQFPFDSLDHESTEEHITTMPVTSYQDKPAKEDSFGCRVSNTMRNVASIGLQVVNDFDAKAATRAQFSFDGADDQYSDNHVTTMPSTRCRDKSSTNSSLGSRVSSSMRNLAEVGLQVIHDLDEKAARHARFSLDSPTPMAQEPVNTIQTNPFEKWLHTIKRRGGHRKATSCDMPRNGTEGGIFERPNTTESRPGHRKSLSGSSFGFVSNMKSVGTSLASFSIAPRSRTGVSSRHQRTDYSSRASYAGRASEDNANCLSRGFIMDKDVLKRMEQRQGVIEEIISTEKVYLDDIRALIRVFDGLLLAIPILSQSLRKSIALTLKDIWTHNNELYNELVKVVANTNKFSGVVLVDLPSHPPVKGHKRWQSLGEVPASESTDSRGRHIGDPKVAGEIAKVFCGKIPGLFLYESYGIMHKEVMKQIHTTYRTTDEWKDFNQAIRSTEEMIVSTDNRKSGSQKGRIFEDYFIKPIHRIARYEVLFGRLLEQSPVCDCPESSTTVETTLFRIKELHKTMNSAAGNHQKVTTMSRTWLLQDHLVFTSQPESRSRDKIRTLEQNHLCGVLHACWQTKDTIAGHNITGQYFIALLYEKFFVLAQPSGNQDEFYAVQACIPISELSVEDVDNGKGLQCHTAPHSWKIVFEHISQLFEIIMSACSAKEELEWKSRLIDRSGKQCDSTVQQEMTASLSLDIKPMGTIYGKPGTIARRKSIHRATTMKGQTTIPRSVIVRNTSATTEPSISSSASQLSINRSQSLAGPHRPTILAPPRTERVRLETLLADVWTRDIIPYPGMGSKPHREHTVRASASSMMRKISHASISSITKRSGTGSIASLHKSEDHTATEMDSLRPMILNRQARHNSSDSMPLPDLEHSLSQDTSAGRHSSRLAVIIDEKESNASTNGARSTSGSPIMARLASFKSKNSEGSLADSLISKRSTVSKSPSGKSSLALPVVTAAHGEELRKENMLHLLKMLDDDVSGEEVAGDLLQAQQRKGRNRTMLVEGFKNFFR